MIDQYSWGTPNGHKVHIMLEETELEYTVHPINIRAGDQFNKKFLTFSPNNRIPAMIDLHGAGENEISVFESVAMLIYLADKTHQFLPSLNDDPVGHYDVLQWLMFQMGGVGQCLDKLATFVTMPASERVRKNCNTVSTATPMRPTGYMGC